MFAAAAAIALITPSPFMARDGHDEWPQHRSWIGTWAASPQGPDTTPIATTGFTDQTLRQIIFTSLGGDQVRVRFTNEFSNQPLNIGAAEVALADENGAIKPGSGRPLTFGGQTTFTIVPNAQVVSDPVQLSVPATSELAIDIYLPGSTGPVTWHRAALSTTYISPAGNYVGEPTLPAGTTAQNYFFLKSVEVLAPGDTGVVVAFGDSITDGTASTPNTNNRYPNQLARLLAASYGRLRMAVLNQGIAGNRVLGDSITGGPNVQSRFDRDVLSQPGVTRVIVLIGINDSSNTELVADRVIAGHKQLILRAHARGLKIYGATLTPAGSTGTREANRQAINAWIRTSGAYDAVIDFDAATLDPTNPAFFLPAYNSGDNLHPSDAGYAAMAQAAYQVLRREF
ncbi:MAG: SGNH/GDSL hydrolase family protein [Blastocatellia bacterium]|nr:SGNH/GDSL hydrolase family protein [Blastocatellia bacterium]